MLSLSNFHLSQYINGRKESFGHEEQNSSKKGREKLAIKIDKIGND
jgi:hypothetical protein